MLFLTDHDAASAWREIEGRIRPFVARRVSRAADVDDVLQEVFLRLSRGLPSLSDDERLAPWVFSITRHVVTDHHRKSTREPLASEAGVDLAGEEQQHDDGTERLQTEMSACVAGFVAMLPDEYREAITLVEIEGVSQKDAAAMLGLSHSGVKSRVQRGRAQLRRMFEGACNLELDARRKVIECQPRSCGGCAPDE